VLYPIEFMPQFNSALGLTKYDVGLRMMFKHLMRLWLGLGLAGCAAQTPPPSAPVAEIPSLPLTEFKALPPVAVEALRGCRVPQAWDTPTPHNVITGSFAQPGQIDWAIVCTEGGRSAIRVVWGGRKRCPQETELASNANLVKILTKDKVGYLQRIDVADTPAVASLNKRYGQLIPLPILAQGIRQTLVGQTQNVHYCHEGKWYRLQVPS